MTSCHIPYPTYQTVKEIFDSLYKQLAMDAIHFMVFVTLISCREYISLNPCRFALLMIYGIDSVCIFEPNYVFTVSKLIPKLKIVKHSGHTSKNK